MRILDIAFKDLSQIFRDKRSLVFLVAMPVIMTLFMGFAYKSGTETPSGDSRLVMGWVNNDIGGQLSPQLVDQLSSLGTIRLIELSPETMEEAVSKGEAAGVLVIPAGFSEAAQAGSPPQLKLVVNTAETGGQPLFQLLSAPLLQFMSSIEIARLSTLAVGSPTEFEPAFSAAAQAWAETDSTALIDVQMAVAEPEQAWYGDNPYNQASPGILVMFSLFGLTQSAQVFMQERRSRTLQRMMTTSLQPWQIVAGHMLAMFALVFLQIALLAVFGQLVLSVDYFRAPAAILLVSIALGLWIAVMGLLIGVFARNEPQVELFSLLAMFAMSALGGAWFPLEASSGAFATISKLTPAAWAMTAYQNILLRGLGFESILLPVLILLGYALALFLLAAWRFGKLEI